jgi:hypothetical protein
MGLLAPQSTMNAISRGDFDCWCALGPTTRVAPSPDHTRNDLFNDPSVDISAGASTFVDWPPTGVTSTQLGKLHQQIFRHIVIAASIECDCRDHLELVRQASGARQTGPESAGPRRFATRRPYVCVSEGAIFPLPLTLVGSSCLNKGPERYGFVNYF